MFPSAFFSSLLNTFFTCHSSYDTLPFLFKFSIFLLLFLTSNPSSSLSHPSSFPSHTHNCPINSSFPFTFHFIHSSPFLLLSIFTFFHNYDLKMLQMSPSSPSFASLFSAPSPNSARRVSCLALN